MTLLDNICNIAHLSLGSCTVDNNTSIWSALKYNSEDDEDDEDDKDDKDVVVFSVLVPSPSATKHKIKSFLCADEFCCAKFSQMDKKDLCGTA